MSLLGITRIHGKAETGASSNLTGTKSSFFSGYQPLVVKVQTLTAKNPLASGTINGSLESLIKAAETVGSVISYGAIATAEVANSSTILIAFDAASLNQGDGVAGSGVTTGLALLKSAIASGLTAGSAVDGNSATVGTSDFVCSVVTLSGSAYA
jgi:hypothetical protein